MSVTDDFRAVRDRLPARGADDVQAGRGLGSGIEHSETDFPGPKG